MATSTSSWLDQLRNQKYSLLPTRSSPQAPDILPRTASFRKKLMATSLAALLLVATTGYMMRSEKVLSPAQPYSEEPDMGLGEVTLDPFLPDDSDVMQEDTPPVDDAQEVSEEEGDQQSGVTEDRPSSWFGGVWGGSPTQDDEQDYTGWTEQMGWRPASHIGLTDLGEVAEGRYRLNTLPGEQGSREYFRRLYDFAVSLPMALHVPLLTSLYRHAPPQYPDAVPTPPFLPNEGNTRPAPPAMIAYKHIHQTDKEYNPDNDLSQKWKNMNEADGWTLNFLDDAGAQSWTESQFGGSQVVWAWHFMHRGVLKADFLRYLLPLVVGGVYSDVDTEPIRPIEQWGHTDVEYLDLHATDGPDWRKKLSTHPAVIVAVDVDVHAYQGWENSWPRPVGICQWTLSSAPGHPIFLDAVRRVVNASRVVSDWEDWRAGEIQRLESEGRNGEAQDLQGQHRDHAMNVMEWTGPGLFTDSVMSYILARFDVTWHRLRGLNHPLRIGDVLILPITGFSPGGQPDFKAEGPDSPQANVLHNFRGSWKGDGAR
ncbi:hypothetical protein IAU60_005959 [Kwoniella sp. DSM 27419]